MTQSGTQSAAMLALLLMLPVIAAPAAAQEMSADDEAVNLVMDRPISFNIHLGIWQARPGGDFALAASPMGNELFIDEDLQLDNSESIFNVELTVRKGPDWFVRGSGFAMDTTRSASFGALNPTPSSATFGALTLDPGDTVISSLEITSVGVDIGRTMYRPLADGRIPGNVNRFGRPIADLRLGPTLGLRVADIETRITEVGVGTDGASMTAAALMIGANLEFVYEPDQPIVGFIRSFSIEGFGGAGPAFGGGLVFQIGAGITGMITPNFGAYFGYRLLEFRVEDGPFEFDAGLQGLFVGGRVTF